MWKRIHQRAYDIEIWRFPLQTLDDEAHTFRPLSCNEHLSKAPCNTLWSEMFTNATNHSEEIVVPCGKCVIMDDSVSLVLEGGLDIRGKLVILDGHKLTLHAPYIRVQGELHMNSTKIPNGEPDVKFVLTGTDEELTEFVPVGGNEMACGGQPCSVGKKPIVIAGGKLVIEALPTNFPSWVHLYDVIMHEDSQRIERAPLF